MGGKHPENKWWICLLLVVIYNVIYIRFPLVAGNTFPMAETDMRLGSSTTLGRCRGVPLNDTLRCHQTWAGNPIEISIDGDFHGKIKEKMVGFPRDFPAPEGISNRHRSSLNGNRGMAAMACCSCRSEGQQISVVAV